MMISSMNRTFDRHGKKVLLVLSVLLSIVFISFFTEGAGSGCGGGGNPDDAKATYGSVFGRPVSVAETRKHQEMIGMAADQNDPFIQYAFGLEGIAAYDAAKKLGITVTEEDIARYTLERFKNPDGTYDIKGFETFKQNLKVHRGIPASRFDEAVARYLTIRKVFMTAPTAPIVLPGEEQAFAAVENETFETDVFWFRNSDYKSKAVIADTQISAAYDAMVNSYNSAFARMNAAQDAYANAEPGNDQATQARFENLKKMLDNAQQTFRSAQAQAYMTPERFDGLVACFAFRNDDRRNAMLAAVTDSEIENYYDTNKHMFYDFSDTAKLGENFKPLAAVKEEVRQKAADVKIRQQLQLAASQIAHAPEMEELETLPKEEQTARFRAIAERNNAKVEVIRNFSTLSCDIPGIGTENNVADALVRLIDGNPVTEVVEGYQGYYVAFRTKATRSAIESFDAAQSKIRQKLIDDEATRLAGVDAAKYAADAGAAALISKSIASVKGPTPEAFAFAPNNDSMPKTEKLQRVAVEILETPAGQVSRSIPVDNDFAVIYVKSRAVPAFVSAETRQKRWESLKQEQYLTDIFKWLSDNTTTMAISR